MDIYTSQAQCLSDCRALHDLPLLPLQVAHGLTSLVLLESVLDLWVGLLHVQLQDLIFIDFLLNYLLGIST